MGIYYGDLPVGGGSGKAEWDKIEGKPFGEDKIEPICICEYNDNLQYNIDSETQEEWQSNLWFGLECETLVVGGQYILEYNGNQYSAIAIQSELTEEEQEYYSSVVRISSDDSQSFVFTQSIYNEEYGSEVSNSISLSPDIVNTSGIMCWNCSTPTTKEDVMNGNIMCCESGTICTQEIHIVRLYKLQEKRGQLYQECIPTHEHLISDLPIVVSTEQILEGNYLKAGTLYFVYEE